MVRRESVFGNPFDPSSPRLAIPRRTLLGGVGGAIAALLASPRAASADLEHLPNDPFIVLLRGIYEAVPVGDGPSDNLGLTTVNLSDGSFIKTRIYAVWGIDGANDQKKPIGNFFFHPHQCAYDLPGGSLAMNFTPAPSGAPPGFQSFVDFPDGEGGAFREGTFELAIIEATGVYQAFLGGHNHMVDRLHRLADGRLDEFCFCNISTYPFP